VRVIKLAWHWFFTVQEVDRGIWRIILWWELRRIPYNIMVGILGIPCFAIFMFSILYAGNLSPGEDAVEPLATIFAPIALNIAYCAGAVAEITLHYLWRVRSSLTAPSLLKLGITFSILITIFPAVFWGLLAFIKLFGIR
jgi:hypothetical protein